MGPSALSGWSGAVHHHAMSGRSSRPRKGFHRPAVWIGVASAVGLAALLAVVILPSRDGPGPSDDALVVAMKEMAFVPEELHAAPGQEIYVENVGSLLHSMLVVGLGKGVEVASGEARSFTLPEDVTGTYEIICDIPGHRELGMVGTLTIGSTDITGKPSGGS